jgi:hypothetical protein
MGTRPSIDFDLPTHLLAGAVSGAHTYLQSVKNAPITMTGSWACLNWLKKATAFSFNVHATPETFWCRHSSISVTRLLPRRSSCTSSLKLSACACVIAAQACLTILYTEDCMRRQDLPNRHVGRILPCIVRSQIAGSWRRTSRLIIRWVDMLRLTISMISEECLQQTINVLRCTSDFPSTTSPRNDPENAGSTAISWSRGLPHTGKPPMVERSCRTEKPPGPPVAIGALVTKIEYQSCSRLMLYCSQVVQKAALLTTHSPTRARP